MRTLLVLRHAKSDRSSRVSGDHERGLNARGERDAATVGRWLTSISSVPDLALTSTAVRATTTLDLARKAGDWQTSIVESRALYLATVRQTLDTISGVGDDVQSLAIVGHQPTWSALVERLHGGGAVRMPTAACARVDLDIHSWSAIGSAAGELRWLVTPKLLTGMA